MGAEQTRTEELTLRMLGENVTFTRSQWEQLADMLNPKNEYDAQDAAELYWRIQGLIKSES